jgi:hypothetical protein
LVSLWWDQVGHVDLPLDHCTSMVDGVKSALDSCFMFSLGS